MELIERESRMIERRIKAAKFPSAKSLSSFDFKIMPNMNKPLTTDLARWDYVDIRASLASASAPLSSSLLATTEYSSTIRQAIQ